jgi:hypothetical protein
VGRSRLLLALALLGFAHWWFGSRPVAHEPGVLVPDAPRQSALADAPAFQHEDYLIQPLARYVLKARVLSRRDYRFDAGASLSQTDLALGWQRMSDSAVLERMRIEQGARWYIWRADVPPLPVGEITRSSANTHMIAGNAAVAAALRRVRAGSVVRLEGLLVEASRDDGYRWRSSLSREDSGGGACELLWVERLEVR